MQKTIKRMGKLSDISEVYPMHLVTILTRNKEFKDHYTWDDLYTIASGCTLTVIDKMDGQRYKVLVEPL